jgi:exosome complex RNA-binding protein Rrp42 (RNase PH superfamily)
VGGALLDCAVLAVRAALRGAALPRVGVGEDGAARASLMPGAGAGVGAGVRAGMRRDPICVTVGVLGDTPLPLPPTGTHTGTHTHTDTHTGLLLDPTLEELSVCAGRLSAAFDESGGLCYMDQRAGGGVGAGAGAGGGYTGDNIDSICRDCSVCSIACVFIAIVA